MRRHKLQTARFPSVAFLFVAQRNAFPFAATWQAYLAAAPSPFAFSVYVACQQPERLPSAELHAMLAFCCTTQGCKTDQSGAL